MHTMEKLKFSFNNCAKKIELGLFENISIDGFAIKTLF